MLIEGALEALDRDIGLQVFRIFSIKELVKFHKKECAIAFLIVFFLLLKPQTCIIWSYLLVSHNLTILWIVFNIVRVNYHVTFVGFT